jgi:hypothetical protein
VPCEYDAIVLDLDPHSRAHFPTSLLKDRAVEDDSGRIANASDFLD